MNCKGCGHNYPNTLTRCPRCKLAQNRRGQQSLDSRLIEFPKKARLAEHNDQTESSLPSWRLELNEKVRAARARRNNPALQSTATDHNDLTVNEAETGAAAVAVRQTEIRAKSRISREMHSYSSEIQKQDSAPRNSVLTQSSPERAGHRSSETIVEAALTRVRRASENASRAALPKIEPVRQVAQTAPLTIDKEATARALEPSPEISMRASLDTLPLPVTAQSSRARPDILQEPPASTRIIEPKTIIEPDQHFSEPAAEASESHTVIVLDEIEPLDYLEAEIRKVDRALSAELSKTDSLSFFTHVVINAIDLFVIAISSLPFVALVGLENGTFAFPQTQWASAAIITLVAFFYLSLTQSLSGKTFGMMFTNTRIVDARTAETVAYNRAILRSIGYFLAVAPALLGIIWAAFNKNRRGWHDYISDTQVVADF